MLSYLSMLNLCHFFLILFSNFFLEGLWQEVSCSLLPFRAPL